MQLPEVFGRVKTLPYIGVCKLLAKRYFILPQSAKENKPPRVGRLES